MDCTVVVDECVQEAEDAPGPGTVHDSSRTSASAPTTTPTRAPSGKRRDEL